MNSNCLRCGTPRPENNARFCQRCGARLDAPATTDPLIDSTLLGRYRVQASSMIALTNLATDDAIAAMHRRYPDLPWPTSTR